MKRRAVHLCALGVGVLLWGWISTGAAQEPVRIGVLLPYTGVYAVQAQDNTRGLELYLKQVGGQAGGRPIVLVKEDEQATPDVGLTRLRKLVDRDRVDIVFGPVHGGVALAIRQHIHSHRVPWVIPQAAIRELTAPGPLATPSLVRLNETLDQANVAMGRWLPVKTQHRRFIVVASNFQPGRQAADAFKAGVREAGGEIVKEVYPPLATADYAPFLSQIDPAAADAVYAWVAGADAVRFVKQYAEFGLKEKLPLHGYATLTDDVILPALGDAALGVLTTGAYTSQLAIPANTKFVKDYEAAYGSSPSRYSETGYTGAQLIVRAVQLLAGDLKDRDAVVGALRKAAGQIESPRGPVRLDRYGQVVPTIYITRTERKEGKLVNSVVDEIANVTQESTWGWWMKDQAR
jgi:branched-chain amino acid transport system substrate-binding protein